MNWEMPIRYLWGAMPGNKQKNGSPALLSEFPGKLETDQSTQAMPKKRERNLQVGTKDRQERLYKR
jgi:hypothetical protein